MKHFLSRKSAAFTLAELLIATAITGLIIILLGQIFSSASAMWRVSDQRTDARSDVAEYDVEFVRVIAGEALR